MKEFVRIDSEKSQLSVDGDILIEDAQLEILADMTFSTSTNQFPHPDTFSGWSYSTSSWATEQEYSSPASEIYSTASGETIVYFESLKHPVTEIQNGYELSFFYYFNPIDLLTKNYLSLAGIIFFDSGNTVVGHHYFNINRSDIKVNRWISYSTIQESPLDNVTWNGGVPSPTNLYVKFRFYGYGSMSRFMYPKLVYME